MATRAERLIPGLLCLWMLLANPTAWAEFKQTPEIYLADIHGSDWTFSGSKSNCELSHEIPGFGTGRFQRLAVEELTFRIDSLEQVAVGWDARLHEVSPPWIHVEPDPVSRKVKLLAGKTPLRLSGQSAAWLLASLAKGQIGSFDLYRGEDGRKVASVQLSPVNYQRSYTAFRQCLRQISDKGYVDYRHLLVHYPLGGDKLDKLGKQQLDGLVEFVLADKTISRIQIAGHTDNLGRRSYNKTLSRRRAQGVRDYLVRGGLNPELLHIEALGEIRPKRRGNSERARAVNRRVEIDLIRSQPGSS
jgi:outer membrane protein OmpA-like peptidoglycan-associated protein